MKQQNLILIAGGAAVAAYFLFFRKSGVATGGGFGGGSAGVPSSGAPATSFTTNVKPGGGAAITPGRTLTTGGLQSAMALSGDIGGLLKGVGQIGKDLWGAVSGAAKSGYEFAVGDWRSTPEERMERAGVGIIGGNPLDDWSGAHLDLYTPAGTDLSQRSFGLDDPAADYSWEPDADGYWTAY